LWVAVRTVEKNHDSVPSVRSLFVFAIYLYFFPSRSFSRQDFYVDQNEYVAEYRTAYVKKDFEKLQHVETYLLPTDAHNVKKHRVIKTF